MKTCTICKESKSEELFNKHKTKKDGLQSHCRECNRKRSKAYYHSNQEKHKNITTKRKKRMINSNGLKIIEYLLFHPCVDCGEKDILCLDFDHQKDKKRDVSQMIFDGLCWEQIQEEIDKCSVRCANCHRRKTHKERNSFKYQYLVGSSGNDPVSPA